MRHLCSLLLLLSLVGPLAAQPAPDPSPAEVDALVEKLGARRYAEREEASQALKALGPRARAALTKGLKSESLEVRSRCKQLLDLLGEALQPMDKEAFKRRAKRAELAKLGGGSAKTEAAVDLALGWLVKHQDESGKWDSDGFMKHDPPADPNKDPAKLGWIDPGVTGLAALALMGGGDSGPNWAHKANVQRAITYLTKIQAADGLVGGKRGHYMYNHAIATLALTEAAALGFEGAQPAAKKALTYLVKARNPGMAWRYGERDGDNDVSVTAWCCQALYAAKVAGIPGPWDKELKSVRDGFITNVTDGAAFITGYKTRPPRGWRGPTSSRFVNNAMGVNTANSHAANHTPTAIGLMIQVHAGTKQGAPALQGRAALAGMLPKNQARPTSTVDAYYWYFGSQAMFQIGGNDWNQWNQATTAALLARQAQAGSAKGSWPAADDAWGLLAGRVYTTAIGALTLQTYYRYPRRFGGK